MGGVRNEARPLSLKANFVWTFFGNGINAASLWGILVVIARLADPSAVGQFVLGLAISAPIMAVAMLQLRNLLVTDAVGQFQFADYFGVRVVWTGLGLLAIGAIVVTSRLEPQAAIVVLLVGVAKCADSLSDIVRGLFQRLERMDYSGKSLMLRGPTALMAMALVLVMTKSLPWAVAAMALVWVVTFCTYDLGMARVLLGRRDARHVGSELRPRIRRSTLVKMSWMALPLGVVMGLISLQTNIPRYLLESFHGSEALGYFGALAYPMMAATMIAAAMGQSASPRLARHFLDDPAAYCRLLTRLVGIAAGLGISIVVGAWALGRPVLTLLYGEVYAEFQPAFLLLALATAIQLIASCGGFGLTAARHIRIQVPLVGLTCAVTAAAALVCVPRWGVRGGAMAVLVTSSAMFVLHASAVGWAVARRVHQGGPARGPKAEPAVAGDVPVRS